MNSIDLNALHSKEIATRLPGWLVVFGLAVLYVPTISHQFASSWSLANNAHAPLILAVSAWFAWRARHGTCAEATLSATVVGSCFFAFGLFLYVVGRSQSLDTLEVGSAIPVGAGLLLLLGGWPGLRRMALPLFFLFFLVPLPNAVVEFLTSPLKAGVSWAASELMAFGGYPVARSGVVINVGQYQLLVADACAGLSSIFTLEALALIYVHLIPAAPSWRKWALCLLAVPIAFAANVLRVIVLIAVTYHLGDEAGQGFAHDFAGILLFVVAVILLISIDNTLVLGQRFFSKRIERNAVPAT
jgi:exosortase B